MKKLLFFSAVSLMLLPGCGGEKPATTSGAGKNMGLPAVIAPQVYEKKETPKYVYKGDRFRDPFITLTGSSRSLLGSDEVIAPNIGTLALKGMIIEGKSKMALINGEGSNFILKDSRLYDGRQRLIKGITGVIKKDSVLMISDDGLVKELKLRENQ